MKKLIISLFLLCKVCPGFAQAVNVLNDGAKSRIELNFALLTDYDYTFNQIHTNPSLKFLKTNVLSSPRVYWAKVILYNPSDHAESFLLTTNPNYDNTLYRYNAIDKKWIADRSGIVIRTRPSMQGIYPYQVAGRQYDTVYFKINLNTKQVAFTSFKLIIRLIPQSLADTLTQSMHTGWLVGVIVLLLFFVNNLYIYFSFKDHTIWYYLLIQLGGMIYLTTYVGAVVELLPYNNFSFLVAQRVSYYDAGTLIMHVSIVILFYGFIQLTRSYLNTKVALPLCNGVLKYGLYSYFIFSAIIAVLNMTGRHVEYYTLSADNVFCLFLLATILCTSIAGYLRKLPNSGGFLLANFLPLFFMCGVTIYHVLVNTTVGQYYWFIVMAACAQALSFSIALVSRTKAMRASLLAKEIESRQLTFNLKEVAYQNQLNENELLKINAEVRSEKFRNELLNERVEAHQRQLASSTLFMVQKNELLSHLKTQIKELKRSDRYNAAKNLDEMIALLDNSNQLDLEWHKFKMHFEQVHPHFFGELKKQHPSLTQKETRLYAYFEMKLSHKEIAALLDIDQASVRRAKTRLLKKMSGC